MPTPWKGLSLDIARSFYPLDVLMRLVDRIAVLGLNVLHLHLSDDQGWRLEIPGHPELTERSGMTASKGSTGGFLTVADYQALVAHASGQGITVVPEIDVPGHTNAALHACPDLNPDGVPPEAYDGAKVGFSQLWADLGTTEVFLRDVFGAVAAMTPGPWIHIGGDECHSMSKGEYVALVRLAVEIVEETGKRPIAWQEAGLADLGDRLALQYWISVDGEEEWIGLDPARAVEGVDDPDRAHFISSALSSRAALLAQVRKGAPILMSPARYAYFDQKHHESDQMGQTWAATISMEKARSWDPRTILPEIPETSLLGVEAAIWTEFLPTEGDLTTMLFPRLDAFAEVASRL